MTRRARDTPSVDTAVFEDLGDKRTRVVSTSLFLTKEDCDGMLAANMEEGLNQSFEALDKVLEKLV